MSKPVYDPKKEVDLTKVDKKGEYYHVKGVVEGREVSVHVPAPSLDGFKTRLEGDAYLRRSLLGTKRMEDSADSH